MTNDQAPMEKEIAASWFQESPVDGDGHTNRQPGTIIQLPGCDIDGKESHIGPPR